MCIKSLFSNPFFPCEGRYHCHQCLHNLVLLFYHSHLVSNQLIFAINNGCRLFELHLGASQHLSKRQSQSY